MIGFLLRVLVLVVIVATCLYWLRRRLRRTQGKNAYDILGIARSASNSEIREAYHREISKYHPDKVAHLGKDLQDLAKRKTAEIIEAYEQLGKESTL